MATTVGEIHVAIRPDSWRRRRRWARLAQAIAPERCPYCGARVRFRPRRHVETAHPILAADPLRAMVARARAERIDGLRS